MSELDHVLHAQISTRTPTEGLAARVDELIKSHHTQALLSTTSTTAAVGELVGRNEGLEQAIRALALAIENLGAAGR